MTRYIEHFIHSERFAGGIPGVYELLPGGAIEPVRNMMGYTPRVGMRMFLHEQGLCGMFACVVSPGTTLNISDFHKIQKLAQRVNTEDGNPYPVEKLVIRTRNSTKNGQAKLGGTNAMGFVDVSEKYFPVLSGKDRWGMWRNYPTVSMWEYFALDKEMSYLIHAEQEGI